MILKPDGTICQIREQIIEDPVSGMTLQIARVPESDAPFRVRIYGDLPHGNREFLFDENGVEAGAGTAFSGCCRPSWLRQVKG